MENHKPLVSVLMTAYNREKYIAEAIESVLASSYTNFELIIVDDCSKDKTVEIARAYEVKDPRIRVYINEHNLGDYPNRNKAASYAKGKYLKYVDADDMIYPWGLEIDVTCMEKYPDAGYGLDSISQDNKRIFPIILNPDESYKYHYFEQGIFHKAPTSCIIPTKNFIQVNGFSGKQHVGDFELWLKLSRYFNVLLLPHGVVWSRNHPEQQMESNRNDSLVPFKYTLIELEALLHKNCPLSAEKKYEIILKVKQSQARSILYSIIKERNLTNTFQKKQLAKLSWFEIFRLFF